jgi:hypothetical protein
MMRRACHALPLLALTLIACTERVSAPESEADANLVNARGARFRDGTATLHWQAIARQLVVENQASPPQILRNFAALGVAQFNSVIAAEKEKARNMHPSLRAAVSASSVVTLSYLFPEHASALEAQLREYLGTQARGGERQADIAGGEAIGREVASQVVAHAETDNFFVPWNGTVPVGPGFWFSTSDPPGPPLGAQFGAARPYLLDAGDQFRPPPPPAFGSAEFLAALAEVRHFADTRTPEQDSIARFWAFEPGTQPTGNYWYEVAAELADRHHLRERQAAHLFALMGAVAFDALIASHDAKFAYWFSRPPQADSGIELAIGMPNFPSYPSNHATISSAVARILGATFPRERKQLDAQAEQAALSRVYGGIHYRFDGDAGLDLGHTIAAWALEKAGSGRDAMVLR